LLKIYSFTNAELQYFRDNCNFTDDERICFELRSKDLSNVQIADKMNVSLSKVCRLVKRVKIKILKVL
jgi:orotate phosphoribosyltransferase-like protein